MASPVPPQLQQQQQLQLQLQQQQPHAALNGAGPVSGMLATNPSLLAGVAGGVANNASIGNREKMVTLVNELQRRNQLFSQGHTPGNNAELATLESWFTAMLEKTRMQKQVALHQVAATNSSGSSGVAAVVVNGATPQASNGVSSAAPTPAAAASPTSAAPTPASTSTPAAPPTSAGGLVLPPEPIDLSTSPGLTFEPSQQHVLKSQIIAYKALSKNLPLDERLKAAMVDPKAASAMWTNGTGESVNAAIDEAESLPFGSSSSSSTAKTKNKEKDGTADPADDDPTVDYSSLAYPYNTYTHPRDALKYLPPSQSSEFLPITASQRGTVVPSLLPSGLDVYELKQAREKFIEGRMRWRLGELQSMSSNLGMDDPSRDPGYLNSRANPPVGQKLKALIEMKSLQLFPRQRLLREQIAKGLQQATSLALIADRTAFRRTRKPQLREARETERLERQQKAEREKKAKQRHLDHIEAVSKHSAALKQAHTAHLDKYRRLGKGILKFHVEAEKEEQRRVERLSKERLKALRADDEEGYLKLIDKTKDTRITHLLKQTDAYLDSLSQAVVEQQNEATVRDGAIPIQGQAGGAMIDESAFGAAPIFEEDKVVEGGKADYYNVAHRIKEEVTKQSSLLVGGTLKEYQIKGLQWMVSLYNNRLNGILADEMGLGKTIQTISLITYLIEHKRQRGPYLVIVPLSTMPNWTLEFEKWAPAVTVVCYKGSPAVRKQLQSQQLRQGQYQVLLTTYEYIIKDRPALSKIRWAHMIIDEGHRMKNANSKLSLTLNQYYNTRHRLILTGTPLQNNLPELWSLLNFVLPKVFNSVKSFDEWFNAPFANTGGQDKIELNEEEAILVIRRLHKVLRPFLLRRLKKDVESELPDKVERVIKCKMSALQAKLTHMLKTHKVIFTEQTSGGEQKGLKGLQNVIMQLKKLCNHPFTFEEVEVAINGPSKPTNDSLWRSAGKFELLDRILPKLFQTGHRVLMFFQMTQVMDIFQDYCAYRGIKNLRLDGTTKPEERADLLRIFNAPGCDIHLFLLSTRAGGLGLNLQTADTVIIFDSDWNPHQDLQAQDRAHRIGQKKEVRVLRLITSKSVEEHIMSKAQFKLDMDKKVIQAGRFDNKSSAEERETFLRELLEDDDNEEEGDNELGDEELNDILARSDQERDRFAQMDRAREAEEVRAWKASPLAAAGKPRPERLITVEELPAVYAKEHVVKTKAMKQAEQDIAMMKPRVRTMVHYDDGLTEDQFVAALEDDTTDLQSVIEKKRKRKRKGNSKKKGAVDDDDDDDDDFGSVASGGKRSRMDTPEAGKKRKRSSAPVSYDVSADEDDDPKPKGKKRKGAEDGLGNIRRIMTDICDAMHKPVDDEGNLPRIEFFKVMPDRKQYNDYYHIIKKPIAMKQIQNGIHKKYMSLEQFKEDIYLMFRNARTYNETGSYVYVQAEELQQLFDDMYHRLVGEDGKPRVQPLPASLSKKKRVIEDSDNGSSSSEDEDEDD